MRWITLAIGVYMFSSGWKSYQQNLPLADIPAVFHLVDSDHLDKGLASVLPVTLIPAFNNSTWEAFILWHSLCERGRSSITADHLDDPWSHAWIEAYRDRNGTNIHTGNSTETKCHPDPDFDDLCHQEIVQRGTCRSWSDGSCRLGRIKIS